MYRNFFLNYNYNMEHPDWRMLFWVQRETFMTHDNHCDLLLIRTITKLIVHLKA